jgi:FMNH2-dependent dimethyl sulfone monooxygenase
MRFGYWMPIFGGWLRNVETRGVDRLVVLKALAVESEAGGFDLSLIAELNLNDIKGHRARRSTLDAGARGGGGDRAARAHARRAPQLPLPLAHRQGAVDARQHRAGRISLNVVSSWWKDEASQYGAPFDVHDARYERTEEWLTVLHRLLTEDTVTHAGPLYDLQGCVLEPKPSVLPTVYMGGESPKAKEVIGRHGGAYVMHGDAPDVIAAKIADMDGPLGQDFSYGVSGYVVVRDTSRRRRPSWPASSTCGPPPRRTRRTRTSSPAASSSRRCRSRSTPSPTAGCAPGSSARRSR